MSLLIESEIISDGATTNRCEAAEVVIRLENVSVEYHAPREQIRSFKEYAIRLLRPCKRRIAASRNTRSVSCRAASSMKSSRRYVT